jgi:uncharacterized protein (DUF1697 family)
MIKYVAFLRAINVGGKNLIKMPDLKKIFESAGMKNVTTYIQSGNVIFESNTSDKKILESKIEKNLHKTLSEDVVVFVRTIEELEEIIHKVPFQKLESRTSSKFYITFFKDNLNPKLKLPYFSSKKDVELIHSAANEFYSISHEVNGRFGFPNLFIEKEFGMKATTRNWNTVLRMSTYK